jgi:RsbT co-antagonist protein rsbRD N-terminal domain
MTPKTRSPKHERVGTILRRCVGSLVEDWLARAKQSRELNHLTLSDEDRTGHLPKLVKDLIVRLSKPSASAKASGAVSSKTAIAHGKLRYEQGYTPAMLVHESRILQVTLFETLQDNLRFLNVSLLLTDVATIADEVDAQLAQSMESFMNAMQQAAAA